MGIKLRIKELAEETGATVKVLNRKSGEREDAPVDRAARLGELLGITSNDVSRSLWLNERLDPKGRPTGEPLDRTALSTVGKVIKGFGLDPRTTTLEQLFEFSDDFYPQPKRAKKKVARNRG